MSGKDVSTELLDSLVLGSPAPGFLRPEPKSIVPTNGTTRLNAIRTRHHALARHLAGGMKPIEAAYVTGYTPATVHTLLDDPAFQELVAYYKEQVVEQYLDMHAKLGVLAATAVEILNERLEENPGKFTNEDLRKILETAADRSIAPSKVQQGAGVAINVNFVQPKGQGPTIEGEVLSSSTEHEA